MRVSTPSRPHRRGDRPRLAIVLSGGGARGAYEAGVLKYIREDLAGDLGGQIHFDIICGTSVGAIAACFMAANADVPSQQGKMLCDRWESLLLEEVVSFGIKDFLRAPATLLGSGNISEMEPGERRLGGIVQTRNLERLVRRMMPWTRIRKNKEAGHFESLAVSATDIGSGKTVVFVESGKPLPPWSVAPFVRAQSVRMGPQHCMASAALPLLFPAVQVDQRFYCDGGLRQNTPLSPALRLGADKVLIVSLKFNRAQATDVPEEAQPFPGAVFLAGKILNAFLLDHIDYDLQRMERLSAIMQLVNESADEDLKRRVAEVVTQKRGLPYRTIKDMVISPSLDLGKIAGEIARAGKFKGLGGGPGIRLLRRLATTGGGGNDADLLSYILFDGVYASELVRIGYEDARARHEQLCQFLQDCVVPQP